jgi:DNA polymerase III delta subunit
MITLLTGDNSFEIERALKKIVGSFDGNAERFDGSNLQLSQLPDLLMGSSLFATARLVIIKDLGSNKSIWPLFGDWLNKVSDDVHLVLVESKPDKRTLTYKSLKDHVTVREFTVWSDRDVTMAVKWLMAEAEALKIGLDKEIAQLMVERIGVNQWQLFNALEKISVIESVSVDAVKDIIDANPVENVFNLLETAVRGELDDINRIIGNLKKADDVYAIFALISAQVFQLAAIASSAKTDNPAKDFGIHPFVASKLSSLAKKIGVARIKKIVSIFAEADSDMKSSRAEPWLLVERALIKTAQIK